MIEQLTLLSNKLRQAAITKEIAEIVGGAEALKDEGGNSVEARNYGTVVQVIGPVVDIEFPPGQLPDLYDAIVIDSEDQEDEIKATLTQKVKVTLEAMQHLGNNIARCVAMASTDGIRRGMRALDTKSPIKMPVGRGTLGRVFNVLGEPIDGKGPVEAEDYYPIHRPAPPVVISVLPVRFWRRAVNRIVILCLNRAFAINGLSKYIKYPPQCTSSYRHFNRGFGIQCSHTASDSVCRGHGHTPGDIVAQMLHCLQSDFYFLG